MVISTFGSVHLDVGLVVDDDVGKDEVTKEGDSVGVGVSVGTFFQCFC